jgi:hypothetical protein
MFIVSKENSRKLIRWNGSTVLATYASFTESKVSKDIPVTGHGGP